LEKTAKLLALRQQWGSKITSGAALLEARESLEVHWSSGLDWLDAELGGGLAKGRVTEMIAGKQSGGAGLVLAALLAQARQTGSYALLCDVGGSFSVESFADEDLETLLWVGCRTLDEAVAALDVATRDENFSLLLLDGRGAVTDRGGGVRTALWQRLAQQVRERGSMLVVFSGGDLGIPAKSRVVLERLPRLEDFGRERRDLLNEPMGRRRG
jgi:RecA/RadA recombinase